MYNFEKAKENSIEVFDDELERNTILTRSARMRKFKFYQYKPIQEHKISPSLNQSTSSTTSTPKGPVLLPRDDVLDGKITLIPEQSKELIELDAQISNLEERISDLRNATDNNNPKEKLNELFNLVNKKNDLLRRQMQLNILEQEKKLEKANQELTKELRSLMNKDDSRKTKEELQRQQHLYEQSLALVNKRNELVYHLDFQEKAIEDDNVLKETIKSAISNETTRNGFNAKNQNCCIS